MDRAFIGCSGWSYPWWSGNFYPPGMSYRDFLRHYSRVFPTVEVNMTFYHFPAPAAIASWKRSTPDGFIFAIKMNRAITHNRRLKGVSGLVRSFLGSVSGLDEKLGPVLIQLPPDLGPDHRLLSSFLDALPSSVQFALEFRDNTWMTERTYDLLRAHHIALVLTDPPPPSRPITTADHTYIRWHGRSGPGYEYSDEELEEWASMVEQLPSRSIYGYFNNDRGGAAPRNAMALGRRLGRPQAARTGRERRDTMTEH